MSEDPLLAESRALRESFATLRGMFGGSGNSTITVQAGGVGVWVAATACLVCVLAVADQERDMDREFRRYEQQLAELRQRDKAQEAYLQAIYRTAPELKPKEK